MVLAHNYRDSQVSSSQGLKRKNTVESTFINVKKLRKPEEFMADTTEDTAIQTELNLITAEEPDLMDGSLFDDDDFLPGLSMNETIPLHEIEPIPVEKDFSEEMDFSEEEIKLDEDFGIIGEGHLPCEVESRNASLVARIQTNPHLVWQDPFECDLSSAQFEDDMSREGQLKSMVLFVRQKPMRYPLDGMQQMHGSFSSVTSSFVPRGMTHTGTPQIGLHTLKPNGMTYMSPAISNGAIDASNHPGQKKRKKPSDKRSVAVVPSFTPPNGHVPGYTSNVNMSQAKSKEGVLPLRAFSSKSGKQGGVPTSILPSLHCGLPSVCLRYSILETLFGRRLNYPVDSRLVKFTIKALASDAQTGDLGKATAVMQMQKLRDPLQHAGETDFGPFYTGIISLDSILRSRNAPVKRKGINLPMGVKLPHTKILKSESLLTRDFDQWSSLEDERLINRADDLGYNWNIIAHSLSWTSSPGQGSGRSTCFDSETEHNPIRSAKQCQERWEYLSKESRTTCKEETNDLSLEVCDGLVKREDSIKSRPNAVLIIDPKALSALQATCDTSKTKNLSLRTARIKRASTRRKRAPLAIPGYNNGVANAQYQVQQSHPSHMQSVKTALSMAAGSSGLVPARVEMWPLQLLDLFEKQRQHVVNRQQQQPVPSGSSQVRSTQPQPTAYPSAHSTPQIHGTRQSVTPISNASHVTNHQQELVKQAARAAALGSSPTRVAPESSKPIEPINQKVPGQGPTTAFPMHTQRPSSSGNHRQR